MRRASSSLISYLRRTRRRPLPALSSPQYPSNPSPRRYPSARLLLHGQTQRRNLETLAETPSPATLSPVEQRVEELSSLEEAFESATTREEILAAFAAVAPSLPADDPRLGLACLKVGQHLDSTGDDPAQVLSFALRAVEILDGDGGAGGEAVSAAMARHLAGVATFNLGRLADSLGHLNRASRHLRRLDYDDDGQFDLLPVSHAVETQLSKTKTALGRREEALENLRNCLRIKEMIMEGNGRELGLANRDLAEAYVSVLNFKEALPFCLRAIDLHRAEFGENSAELAQDRRLLAVVYTGLEQHPAALEQNELSRRALRKWGLADELVAAEIDAANIHIAMGRLDEAADLLQAAARAAAADSETRAAVFVSMAKVFCNQGKFGDAKRCLELGREILETKAAPAKAAEAYAEMAMMYETMNEFETAVALLKRTAAIAERLPREQHAAASAAARIGWLLLLTGKVQEALPHLEDAAERMRESFGAKHFGLGYIYNNLGAAYMELDRPQSAAQMFALAKDVMDTALGPHHADAIEACQNLANAYAAMGSFVLGLEFQQKVIDAWENHGLNAKDEIREAHRLLEQMKKKALSSSSRAAAPGKAMPLLSGK
ncbi:tetratricopeptide repeat (TPR)-like superfamily protein [Wolffia australiana]